MLPIPHAFKEFFTAEVVSCESLVNAEALLNLNLRGNTGVVGAGHPKG